MITRDMMPKHPRFSWTRDACYFQYGHPGYIYKFDLLGEEQRENCIAIAYVFWMEEYYKDDGQDMNNMDMAQKWLQLLKPVFGKDWNCWTRKRADGMIDEFCFTEEHPADDNCPIYQKRQGPWKRALFNSKVIE